MYKVLEYVENGIVLPGKHQDEKGHNNDYSRCLTSYYYSREDQYSGTNQKG